jgi:hypothetical protein
MGLVNKIQQLAQTFSPSPNIYFLNLPLLFFFFAKVFAVIIWHASFFSRFSL